MGPPRGRRLAPVSRSRVQPISRIPYRSGGRYRTRVCTCWTLGLEPVAGWGVRGALHCGSGSSARLSGSCGADGGAVCGRPVWRCGEPDVSHRGSGALAGGRGAGVSGPCRCAGEGARVPHRAWRDRGYAGGTCGGGAGCGDRSRGWARGQAAGSLCGGGRDACSIGCGVACVSGGSGCPSIWCRQPMSCWIVYRSRQTASLTGMRCRRRGMTRTSLAPMWRHATR